LTKNKECPSAPTENGFGNPLASLAEQILEKVKTRRRSFAKGALKNPQITREYISFAGKDLILSA